MKHSMGQRGKALKANAKSTQNRPSFNRGVSDTKSGLYHTQTGDKGDSKKDFGYDAPAVVVVNVDVHGASTGKILSLHKGMEYSSDNGSTWTDVTGTSLSNLAAGVYLIRWKKYGMEDDSDIFKAIIHQPAEITGTVVIAGDAVTGNEVLADTSDITVEADGDYDDVSIEPIFTYQWYRGTDAIDEATENKYTLVEDDEGKDITVKVTSTNCSGDPIVSEAITPEAPAAE